MENRGLNLVILHKDTRWKKFKGRVGAWFNRDKTVGETVVVPEIIVTSPEDVPGSNVETKDTSTNNGLEETTEAAPVKFRRSQKGELARAHQDVISQMRESMAEARGGPRRDTNPEVKENVADPVKPPVPPTKAAAVAKIREAIAQAKRESSQDLATSHPENREEQPYVQAVAVVSLTPQASTEPEVNCTQQHEQHEQMKNAVEVAAMDKIRATLLPHSETSQETGMEKSSAAAQSAENTCDHQAVAEKAERQAAVRAKIRAALLTAAAGQVEDGEQRPPQLGVRNTDMRRLSTPSSGPLGGGSRDPAKEMRRKSASGLQQDKPRETIWEFFEEGKKKGTCKTCGYVVGIKNNKGGLTRHLSLVHQREYRDYTARMDKNWTHGMIEKNLNMRVPKNI